jgi:hypothetical protein
MKRIMMSSVTIKSYVGVSIVLLLLVAIAPLFSKLSVSSGSAPAPRATPDMRILTSVNDDSSFSSVRGGGGGGRLDRKFNQSTIKEAINDNNDDIEIDDIQAAMTLKTSRTIFSEANDYDTKVSEEVIVYLIPF